MNFLRYLLIIASAAGAAFPLYLLVFESSSGSLVEHLIVASYVIGLLLNIIYLLYSRRGSDSVSRFARLFRLWLDVKERELRDRLR
jgi:hypothetical protein